MEKHAILSYSFNSDHTCLLCTTIYGFQVFYLDPFKLTIDRIISGGIRLGAMYKTTNIFLLCGTGSHADYPPNRLVIWDDQAAKAKLHISINSRIEGVSIQEDTIHDSTKILIHTSRRFFVYDFDNLELLASFNIWRSLFQAHVYHDELMFTYICPTLENIGKVVYYSAQLEHEQSHDENKYISLHAHDQNIQCIAISNDHRMIATTPIHGRYIKVFNTADGVLLKKYHRGYLDARIEVMQFSQQNNWLLCGSQSGTIHCFSLARCSNIKNLWGFTSFGSDCTIKITDRPISIYVDDTRQKWYIITRTTMYCGSIEGCIFKTEGQFLIHHNKDPFSSPKRIRLKKQKEVLDKDI